MFPVVRARHVAATLQNIPVALERLEPEKKKHTRRLFFAMEKVWAGFECPAPLRSFHWYHWTKACADRD
jgi:hypothetical protein